MSISEVIISSLKLSFLFGFSAFFPFYTAAIVEIDVFFKIFSAKNLKIQIKISRLLPDMPFWVFHILSFSIQSFLLVCFLSFIINFLSVFIQFRRSVDWYHTFWISQTKIFIFIEIEHLNPEMLMYVISMSCLKIFCKEKKKMQKFKSNIPTRNMLCSFWNYAHVYRKIEDQWILNDNELWNTIHHLLYVFVWFRIKHHVYRLLLYNFIAVYNRFEYYLNENLIGPVKIAK